MQKTLGEKRCGLDRPDERQNVVSVRREIAKMIDDLEKLRGDKNTYPANSEKQRLISLAQTKLEEACLFAVKAMYS